METLSRGLELVNSVFMQFTRSGSSFKELPKKVIDVGWGHERLVWFTQGTLTGYDAVFGPVIGPPVHCQEAGGVCQGTQ
jgi:alanyl-tRNA synthetase